MITHINVFLLFFLCGIILMISGCHQEVDEEVKDFVTHVKNTRSDDIEPLPIFKKPKPSSYSTSHLRSPFESSLIALVKTPSASMEHRPEFDLHRPREVLESYPLDSLQMVGTLEKNGEILVLLRDNHGLVHCARMGQYIGQNVGRIEKISGSEILIKEWFPNGKGGWQERHVSIQLLK